MSCIWDQAWVKHLPGEPCTAIPSWSPGARFHLWAALDGKKSKPRLIIFVDKNTFPIFKARRNGTNATFLWSPTSAGRVDIVPLQGSSEQVGNVTSRYSHLHHVLTARTHKISKKTQYTFARAENLVLCILFGVDSNHIKKVLRALWTNVVGQPQEEPQNPKEWNPHPKTRCLANLEENMKFTSFKFRTSNEKKKLAEIWQSLIICANLPEPNAPVGWPTLAWAKSANASLAAQHERLSCKLPILKAQQR